MLTDTILFFKKINGPSSAYFCLFLSFQFSKLQFLQQGCNQVVLSKTVHGLSVFLNQRSNSDMLLFKSSKTAT